MVRLMIAALALAAPVVAQAAPLINGSFESGTAIPGQFTTIGAGDSTSITGWTVASGSVDYIGSYWTAQNGDRSLDMSGNSAATIFQNFTTVANQAYRVDFWLGGNPFGPPPVKSLTVGAGTASQVFTFDTTGAPALPGMNWVKKSLVFNATGTSSTLTFSSNTQGFFGPALDNVSVTAVPEPATWAMMICGFGLVGTALRRRRTGPFAAA